MCSNYIFKNKDKDINTMGVMSVCWLTENCCLRLHGTCLWVAQSCHLKCVLVAREKSSHSCFLVSQGDRLRPVSVFSIIMMSQLIHILDTGSIRWPTHVYIRVIFSNCFQVSNSEWLCLNISLLDYYNINRRLFTSRTLQILLLMGDFRPIPKGGDG